MYPLKSLKKVSQVELLLSAFTNPTMGHFWPECNDCFYWDWYWMECLPYGDCPYGNCPQCYTCRDCYCRCTSECCKTSHCTGECESCVSCHCVDDDSKCTGCCICTGGECVDDDSGCNTAGCYECESCGCEYQCDPNETCCDGTCCPDGCCESEEEYPFCITRGCGCDPAIGGCDEKTEKDASSSPGIYWIHGGGSKCQVP